MTVAVAHGMNSFERTLDRRDALKWLGLMAAGALTGCGELRFVTGVGVTDFGGRMDEASRVLAAFIRTVVPGLPHDVELPIQLFDDPELGFARWRNHFLSDLQRRATARGAGSFAELDGDARNEVVHEGYRASGPTRRLYRGAIFLAEVGVYAGLASPSGAAAIIDFPGVNPGFRQSELGFDSPGRFLAASMSVGGHPA